MSEPDWAEERANAIVVEFMSPLDRTATLLQTDIATALRAAASEAREAALREAEDAAWEVEQEFSDHAYVAEIVAERIAALRQGEGPAKDARGAGKECPHE